MIRSTWTGIVPAEEGTYSMFDPEPAGVEGLPLDGFDRATVNGFIGQGAPWAVYVITGTLFGPVRLTVEVHDNQPDLVEGQWSEVIETEFVSDSGTLRLIRWGGEHIVTLEGVLVPGSWGFRACGRGREGVFRHELAPDDEPVEEHLFQFCPVPKPPSPPATPERAQL